MIDWRNLALWLADCHAATAEYDGQLKSTSKSRRRRLTNIAKIAQTALETGHLDVKARDSATVLKRIKRAVEIGEP